jgi:hypothetical protein
VIAHEKSERRKVEQVAERGDIRREFARQVVEEMETGVDFTAAALAVEHDWDTDGDEADDDEGE